MRFKTTLASLAIIFAASLSGTQAHAESAATTSEEEKSTDSKQTNETEVKVTVAAGDSLSSIAEAHNTTWLRIFNANESIANPDVINPGDELRIPAESEELADRYVEVEVSQQAQATTTYTTQSYTSAPVDSTSYYVGNGMWCTDYVHSRRPDVAIYGNAGYNWIGSAQAAGKSTGTTPQAGAVAVMDGHVAYVESVNADGSYVVSEMGWNYQAGNYNQRTVQPGTFGQFIY